MESLGEETDAKSLGRTATIYISRNVVSLTKSLLRSRKVVKLYEALVGKESGKSESSAVMAEIAVQTLPHPKGG